MPIQKSTSSCILLGHHTGDHTTAWGPVTCSQSFPLTRKTGHCTPTSSCSPSPHQMSGVNAPGPYPSSPKDGGGGGVQQAPEKTAHRVRRGTGVASRLPQPRPIAVRKGDRWSIVVNEVMRRASGSLRIPALRPRPVTPERTKSPSPWSPLLVCGSVCVRANFYLVGGGQGCDPIGVFLGAKLRAEPCPVTGSPRRTLRGAATSGRGLPGQASPGGGEGAGGGASTPPAFPSA